MEEDDPDKEELEELKDKLHDQIEEGQLRDLNRKIERAMDALRCPPGDEGVEHLSGVCIGKRSILNT
jgi:sulfate-transporting ATPase